MSLASEFAKIMYLYSDKYTKFMRFILLLVTLMGCARLSAQSFGDSIYMNVGVEQARNQSVIYDSEDADTLVSKFVIRIDEWSNSSDPSRFESKFSRPFSWIGRQFFFRVGSASAPYTLYINNKEVGKVQNCSVPAEFNITNVAKEGRNSIAIKFDTKSMVGSIEGWRGTSITPTLKDVSVVTQPTQMIRDLKIETSVMGDNLQSQLYLAIKSHALAKRTSTVHYSLFYPNGELVSFAKRTISQSMREEDTISFSTTIPISDGWSGENPNLFTLRLSIQHEGRYLEYQNYEVGFRAIDVDPKSGKISINGEPVTLIAKRVGAQSVDLEAIKSEGFNAIKIEGGTPSVELYNACNRAGVYVVATAAINSGGASSLITKGGNPTNDPKWWGAYMQRLDECYYTSQLHPSVVAFSLADNSLNGYNLYEGYLRLKQKAGTRPVVYFEVDGEWNSDKLDITLK